MEKPERRSVIHLFDPMPHTSPFDINMAVDAGFEVVIPYTDVKLEQVHALVQDAIFSRGPAGVKRTGIFIGERDMGLAITMLEATKKAMVPLFQVSVLAPPIPVAHSPPRRPWSPVSRSNSKPSTTEISRIAGRLCSGAPARWGSPRG